MNGCASTIFRCPTPFLSNDFGGWNWESECRDGAYGVGCYWNTLEEVSMVERCWQIGDCPDGSTPYQCCVREPAKWEGSDVGYQYGQNMFIFDRVAGRDSEPNSFVSGGDRSAREQHQLCLDAGAWGPFSGCTNDGHCPTGMTCTGPGWENRYGQWVGASCAEAGAELPDVPVSPGGAVCGDVDLGCAMSYCVDLAADDCYYAVGSRRFQCNSCDDLQSCAEAAVGPCL